jgi:hypothetical protein
MEMLPRQWFFVCTVCGSPVPLVVDGLSATLHGRCLTVEILPDRQLCLDHLIAATPPAELASLVRKIVTGLGLKGRAGVRDEVTGWFFGIAPELAGLLLHDSPAPPLQVAALAVAVTDPPVDWAMPIFGGQPSHPQPGQTVFAVPIIRVTTRKVYWEFDWSRSTRDEPEMRAELFGLDPVDSTLGVGDLDHIAAGLRLARGFQRAGAGGRPKADPDEQAAEFVAQLPEKIRLTRARWGAGWTKAQLAEAYGWSVDTLDDRLKKADLSMAKLKRRRGGHTPR